MLTSFRTALLTRTFVRPIQCIAPFSTVVQPDPTQKESTSAVWTPESRRTGVIAIKIGMSAIWDEWGVRHPVTILKLDNVQVIQARPSPYYEGMVHLQIGAVNQLPHRVTKPLLGHFQKYGVPPKKHICEFLVTKDAALEPATEIFASHFLPGQYVDVTAPSIGKGFAGAMKRYGFKGLRASHGVSLTHRSLGSTGQRQDPGKVFKGKKMAGRMGGNNVTVHNLKVIKVDSKLNLLYVRGCVPGYDEQYVKVRDAIKMRGLKAFPDQLPPPFPTCTPEANEALPRERVARMSKVDPFMPKGN
jgi:large subunit ribosomal protein L3